MYKYDKKKSFKYSGKITLLNIITCFFENSLTVFFFFFLRFTYLFLIYRICILVFFPFLSHAMLLLKLDKY